jgi:hypothetical protein
VTEAIIQSLPFLILVGYIHVMLGKISHHVIYVEGGVVDLTILNKVLFNILLESDPTRSFLKDTEFEGCRSFEDVYNLIVAMKCDGRIRIDGRRL